jgi:hypothetical protein
MCDKKLSTGMKARDPSVLAYWNIATQWCCWSNLGVLSNWEQKIVVEIITHNFLSKEIYGKCK